MPPYESIQEKKLTPKSWPSKIKIICTLGPASDSTETMQSMSESGMTVGRLNFSHGSHAYHSSLASALRAVPPSPAPSLMLDTKGPEIRVGKISTGSCPLSKGSTVTLTPELFDAEGEDFEGDSRTIPITHQRLHEEVSAGTRLYLDDGNISLTVTGISGNKISALVNNSFVLQSNKGVNVPGAELSLPTLTEKDLADLQFGAGQDVDFVAASFIRGAGDVAAIRRQLALRSQEALVIAKIECELGVRHFDAILAESDGVMVARGDLGIEVPLAKVIALQKEFVRKCNAAGKPVIVATQMLESMTRNPRPTRAEVADVYNAVLDGADVVMLSAESAAGNFPREAVGFLREVANEADPLGEEFDTCLLVMSNRGSLELYREVMERVKGKGACLVMTTNRKLVLWLNIVKNCFGVLFDTSEELHHIMKVNSDSLKNCEKIQIS